MLYRGSCPWQEAYDTEVSKILGSQFNKAAPSSIASPGLESQNSNPSIWYQDTTYHHL